MKFAPRTPEEPEINLISLVDVVFMLLIFFMVTTTFVRSSGLKVSLPQA
ncbi:MAG: ExbD/TolR family protein, partial [Nevskiales bacterium]